MPTASNNPSKLASFHQSRWRMPVGPQPARRHTTRPNPATKLASFHQASPATAFVPARFPRTAKFRPEPKNSLIINKKPKNEEPSEPNEPKKIRPLPTQRDYNRPVGELRAVHLPHIPNSMISLLLSHQEGRLLHLTLNRPEKRNALDAGLCRALVDALDAANQDPQTGAILLTAAGPTFCAGMDLTEIEQGGDTDEIGRLHEQLFTIGARLTRPLIAAVHGPALGGGTGLVANCHIAVAAPQATFGLTEIRLGLWPFLVYRAVEAALGPRRTLELSLTGRIFPAAEARDYALVHEFAEDPVARAREIALALAAASPTAIQTGMRYVEKAKTFHPREAGVLAQEMRNYVFSGDDFREGLRAFREKRPPHWPSIAKDPRK